MSQWMQEDISLTSVTKIFHLGLFRRKIGVEDLSLSVPRGQVVGLLGPNGSGKSTTLKMILGFLKPSQGEILVCGHRADRRAARAFIGYLPENPRFQKFLTATDVLHYYGSLLGLKSTELKRRADELLELVNLKHAGNERVQGFSKGMCQRLAIAQALLNRPTLLIFDEPMSGLDPVGRMEIRKLIARIHEEMPSSTIFFSSHVLTDVEELCSFVALLRKGKLKTFCPLEDLLKLDVQVIDVVVRNLPSGAEERLRQERRGRNTPIGLSLTISGTDDLIANLTELRRLGAEVVGVFSHRKNLEEALFTEKELPSPLPEEPAQVAGAN